MLYFFHFISTCYHQSHHDICTSAHFSWTFYIWSTFFWWPPHDFLYPSYAVYFNLLHSPSNNSAYHSTIAPFPYDQDLFYSHTLHVRIKKSNHQNFSQLCHLFSDLIPITAIAPIHASIFSSCWTHYPIPPLFLYAKRSKPLQGHSYHIWQHLREVEGKKENDQHQPNAGADHAKMTYNDNRY